MLVSATYQHESAISSLQFSSSVLSTVHNPMNCSTPGLPVHHQLPEFTQTHVHQVGDAIQPSHLLSSPSPPAPNPSSIRVFSSESTLHTSWPKYWRFSFSISPSNEQPGLISFRMDWLDLLGETVETVSDFILGVSKISADGGCSHEIKRCSYI